MTPMSVAPALHQQDQFNALKAFCRVETGGFSAAATGLNVPHTVMSKQVRAFIDFASDVYRTLEWA